MKVTKDQLKKLIEQELRENINQRFVEEGFELPIPEKPSPRAIAPSESFPTPPGAALDEDDEGTDLPAGTDIGYSANISRQRSAIKNLILALSPDKGHQYVSKAQASRMFQALGEYNADVGRQQKAWNDLIESFIIGLENLQAAQTKTRGAPRHTPRYDLGTADTEDVPQIARENKKINVSDLRQIIEQELKTVFKED
tara:strand:+ start:295 stop:888 length:594 start_codon:yes stop_codon:yes gene_type:complete